MRRDKNKNFLSGIIWLGGGLLFFILSGVTGVYSRKLPFKHYSVSEGLAQSQVSCILQDHCGFLWFGTGYGVSRFDGQWFLNFSSSDGLAGNQVSSMLEHRSGDIWIGTNRGLSRLKNPGVVLKSGALRVETVTVRHRMSRKGVRSRIRSMAHGRRGAIWVCAEDGIYYSPGSRSDLSKIPVRGLPGHMSESDIQVFFTASDGRIWYGSTRGIGLLEVLPGWKGAEIPSIRGTVYRAIKRDGLFHTVNTITENKDGTIWFGTSPPTGRRALLGSIEPGKGKNFKSRIFEMEDVVLSLCFDHDGDLWAGTNSGVFRIIPGRGGTGVSIQLCNAGSGLSFELTRAIFTDREGNIWIGTNGGGVDCLSNKRFVTYTVKEGLQSNIVYALMEDGYGNIWAGSIHGGLDCISPSGEPVARFSVEQGLSARSVRDLAQDGQGNIWVGTSNGISVFRYVPGQKDLPRFHYYTQKQGLPSEFINRVKVDRRGNVWAAAPSGAACLRGGRRGKKFYPVALPPARITGRDVKTVMETTGGKIWLGTDEGIFIVENAPGPGIRSRVKRGPSLTDTHGQNVAANARRHVTALLENGRGTVWMGTHGGGLGKYNGLSGNTRFITTREGLSHNVVYFIINDGSGFLWVGTNKGVDRLEPESGAIKNFNSGDGLAGDETNAGACLLDSRNRLWFGTTKGLACYTPAGEKEKNIPPLVHIDGLYINDIDKSLLLPGETGEPGPLRLAHYENTVTLGFTGLSFKNPGGVTYRYRLKGINSEWSRVGNLRRISYSQLPPGSYGFEVRAIDVNRVESRDAARFDFVVQPPFWDTWIFKSVAAAVFFLAIFLAFRVRLKIVKNHLAKKHLEKELQLKKDVTAMLVHDLGGNLNCILGYSEMIKRGSMGGEVKKNSSVIIDSAHDMMRLIDDMLDVSRFEAGTMALEKEPADLAGVIRRVMEKHKPLSDEKNIRLETFFEPMGETGINIQRMNQVVTNLLANAMKFSPEGGTVKIFLRTAGDYRECSIVDDGAGVPEGVRDRIFIPYSTVNRGQRRRSGGSGLGLAVARFIVEAHGGSIGYRTVEPRGSEFYFRVPVK